MTARSIEQIVDEQVKNWNMSSKSKESKEEKKPVIAISREAATGGQLLAEQLAKHLGFDFFDQELVHKMAENEKISTRLMKSLDERGSSIIEEWLTAFSEHFWPDHYLKQLIHVVGTIGHHGGAVIVGRGAQHILPSKSCFSVRIVAPNKYKIKHMSKEEGISEAKAEKQIQKEDSERRAFIRKYFHTDISDPHNYDMVLNLNKISFDRAIKTISCIIE